MPLTNFPYGLTSFGRLVLTIPWSYSPTNGGVIGVIDGVNDTFSLPQEHEYVQVYLNGRRLIPELHFTHVDDTITFLPPMIPQPGADIMVDSW